MEIDQYVLTLAVAYPVEPLGQGIRIAREVDPNLERTVRERNIFSIPGKPRATTLSHLFMRYESEYVFIYFYQLCFLDKPPPLLDPIMFPWL
jgi:hypothetical protein